MRLVRLDLRSLFCQVFRVSLPSLDKEGTVNFPISIKHSSSIAFVIAVYSRAHARAEEMVLVANDR